jgi:hypothetical protein
MGSNTSLSWQAQALPEDEVAVEVATVGIAEPLLLNLLPQRPTMFHLLRPRRPERTIQSYLFTHSTQLELSVDAG